MTPAQGFETLRLLRNHLAIGNLTNEDFDSRRRSVIDAMTGTVWQAMPVAQTAGGIPSELGQRPWSAETDGYVTIENLGAQGVASDYHNNYEYEKARVPKGQEKVADRLLPATKDTRMVTKSGGVYDWEIFHAAANNNTKRMEELLEYNVSVDARDPESGNTPLMMAATRGQRQAMMWLVEQGCDVNAQNHTGLTALHMLAQAKQTILAVWLVKQGADIHLEDSRQYSAIDIALPWMQKEMKEAWDEHKQAQKLGPAASSAPSPMGPAAGSVPSAHPALVVPEARFAVHTPGVLPPLEDKAEPTATKVLRVYLKNNAYKTVVINNLTKAGDLCVIMAEKLGMAQFAMSLETVDCIKLNERRLDPTVNLFRVTGSWPTLISTAEDPPLEAICRLKVVPIRGSSEAVQSKYRAAMYGK